MRKRSRRSMSRWPYLPRTSVPAREVRRRSRPRPSNARSQLQPDDEADAGVAGPRVPRPGPSGCSRAAVHEGAVAAADGRRRRSLAWDERPWRGGTTAAPRSTSRRRSRSIRSASIVHYRLAMAYRGLGRLEDADAQLRQKGDRDVGLTDPLLDELSGVAAQRVRLRTPRRRGAEQKRLPGGDRVLSPGRRARARRRVAAAPAGHGAGAFGRRPRRRGRVSGGPAANAELTRRLTTRSACSSPRTVDTPKRSSSSRPR